MTKPIEVCPHCGTPHNDYPTRTCRSCRVVHFIDINALDPLDAQFDLVRAADEQGITVSKYLRERI